MKCCHELGTLTELRTLDIRYLPKLRRLPKSFSGLTKLEELDVSGTNIEGVLDHIEALTSLKRLDVGGEMLVPELYREAKRRFPNIQLS